MEKENIYNLPNALSLYRILAFPFMFYFLYSGNEKYFSIFLCINLVTDVLDGFIARTFKMETKFGARLDSLADMGTYILAFAGVFIFKASDLAKHGLLLYIFIGFYVLAMIVPYFRFGKFPSKHLYSAKITGYLQGILFFTWFFIGFYSGLYYVAIGFGILTEIESLIITFLIKEDRSNLKSLFWVLKERNG